MPFSIIAVYDANILHPAPIRDLFIRIAQTGIVRAKWTEMIHEEWIRNVLKNNPQITRERITQTKKMMNEAIRDCLVTDYEILIDSIQLPDVDDRHVLAAAIQSNAEIIVTYNLKDFPIATLEKFNIEALHPDDFLSSLFEQAPKQLCAAIARQRESLRKPPKSATELLEIFENQGLTQSVAKLRPFVELL